jgi:uncharacterized protein (DUF362 family)
MSTEKSIVSIVKGEGAEAMVKQAVDHLGGVKSLIKPGSTVVVKPNAGHEGAPESSVNTSPEVVSAVIRLVKEANPGRIILAEASAIGCDTMACLETSGIRKAAEDAGVDEIRDIKSDEDLVKKKIENPTSDIKQVELPRFLLEADHLVNVPIFKSHVSMVFTCALKNLKGVVQDKHHYIMHCTDLAAAMMDLGDVVRPDFTVVDMIRPMEGFGPHSGTPFDFGCIVAGRDMVAIDATACRMVGLPLDKVELRRGEDRDPREQYRGGPAEAVSALPGGIRRVARVPLPHREGVQHLPGAPLVHHVEAQVPRSVRQERGDAHRARPARAAARRSRAGQRPSPDG